MFLLKVYKFSFEIKYLFINLSLYSKIRLEDKIIKNNYKFLC